MGEDGQIILPQQSGGSCGYRTPGESDSFIAMPRQSITLFSNINITQQANGLLKLQVPGKGQSFWWFENIEPGRYQIQLTYKTPVELTNPEFIENWLEGKGFEDLWVGMVYTPFVKFHLEG
jgi:hypothetical protein